MTRRLLALCIALVAGLVARDASAQDCERHFSSKCQGWVEPQAGPPLSNMPVRPAKPVLPPTRMKLPPVQAELPPAEAGVPVDSDIARQYPALYGPVDGDPFPIPAVRLAGIDRAFLRNIVNYPTREPPGTIIIDPRHHFLYFVEGGGRAIRYGVGVGRQGFSWSGEATIHDKQEWPDWYPPKEMFERQPEIMKAMTELQSGIGMPGGPGNPLGARALYLWQNNKDTLYRIHGTVEPWTIGKNVSSGCIRMINQDAIDLYQRASVGAKVVVLP